MDTDRILEVFKQIAESGQYTQQDKEALASLFGVSMGDIERQDIPSKLHIKNGKLIGCSDIVFEPHLLETTMRGYNRRTYLPAIGVILTEEEKRIVAESKEYVKQYEADENKRVLKLAYKDFEQLRDMPNMPDEALDILKQWTSRNEDEEDYEDD